MILILVLILVSGLHIGYITGYNRALDDLQETVLEVIEYERDYYRKAYTIASSYDSLTPEQGIITLESMKRIHIQWANNPQWYENDLVRQANEVRLVHAYGALIELVEGLESSR